ncbi:hypothetical protein DEA98_29210 (plasmid) [Brucella pseudogrignonensis]|nr:hypothetical protein [Brucella pseudogrignonensis]
MPAADTFMAFGLVGALAVRASALHSLFAAAVARNSCCTSLIFIPTSRQALKSPPPVSPGLQPRLRWIERKADNCLCSIFTAGL